jgi:hypothetical protein
MKCLKNLDAWSGGGWGVFIALNQPRHPTVRVLTVSTVGALSSCCTGQSGVAPDMHCALSGAPSGGCSDSTRTIRALFMLSDDRWRRPLHWRAVAPLVHRTVRWHTGQSGGTPDSPVNYSGARSQKPEGEELKSIDPGAPDTVRCAGPGFSSVSFAPLFLNPNLIFLLLCVEPLAPVEYII